MNVRTVEPREYHPDEIELLETIARQVAQAIENKVIQKHEAEAYEYRLTRERQEAERKAIEAEGIRRFQEAINAAISPGYLKWKGIEATLELAKSPNTKIVEIGRAHV